MASVASARGVAPQLVVQRRRSARAAARHAPGSSSQAQGGGGERVGRGVVLQQLGHHEVAQQDVRQADPGLVAACASSSARSARASVGDHHRPLEQRRLERGGAAGDQRHVAGGQRLVRAAVEQRDRRVGRVRRRSGSISVAQARRPPAARSAGRAAAVLQLARRRRAGAARCTGSRSARLPGSSATTRVAVAEAERGARWPRAAAPAGSRRPADGRRRSAAMPALGSRSPARTGTGTARGRPRARIFSIALAAPGPDRRADEVDGLDARCLAACASRPRLKSGASTPMKASGRSRSRRSRQLRRGCRRSRGSAAAPRRSRAPPACRAATRRRSPARPSAGRRCRSACSAGQRALQAAEQQAGQQVARGFARHHREARRVRRHRQPERQRAMPRVRRGQEIAHQRDVVGRLRRARRRAPRSPRAPRRASGRRGTAAGASA